MATGTSGPGAIGLRIAPLLIAAGIAWYAHQQRADFGDEYALQLMALNPDLRVEEIDISDRVSYAMFALRIRDEADPHRDGLVKLLADQLQTAYCTASMRSVEPPDVEPFNVNVRADSAQSARIIVSRALSRKGC